MMKDLGIAFLAIMDRGSDKAVEDANARFYHAIETGSMEAMAGLWLHEEWVRCIHRGWSAIGGWPRVRESWETIFAEEQRMRISPSEVRVRIMGDLAWVNCVENVT